MRSANKSISIRRFYRLAAKGSRRTSTETMELLRLIRRMEQDGLITAVLAEQGYRGVVREATRAFISGGVRPLEMA